MRNSWSRRSWPKRQRPEKQRSEMQSITVKDLDAAVAETATVETVLGAGLIDRAVRVELVMGSSLVKKSTVWRLINSTIVLGMQEGKVGFQQNTTLGDKGREKLGIASSR